MPKVYGLKRATPRMKYQHMNYVLAWRDDLKRKQEEESRIRRENREIVQQVRDMLTQEEYDTWWESAPEIGFFEAAREKLTKLRKAEIQAVINNPNASAMEQSSAIELWMTLAWNDLPEMEL